MSIANKIFTNTLWQVIARLGNILVGVFSLALITRLLGQEGFGFYTTIFAFVQVFMILADLGLYMTLLREISTANKNKPASKIINNIFTIRLVSSGFVLFLIPIVIQFFPYDQVVKNGVVYFMFAFFFQSLISTLTAVFSEKLDMAKVATVDLFNKIIYVLVLVYFVFYNVGNLNNILLGASFVHLTSFGLLYLFIRKYVSLTLAWDFDYWRHVFYTAWPLAVTTVLNLLYFKADTLVLSVYRPASEVGLYGAPYRVLETIASFPHMFMSLILPLFTVAWLGKKIKELNSIMQNTFNFFSIISMGSIVITWLISKPLMILLAGPEFAASGAILNILIVATASIFFGTLFVYLVVALNAQKEMIKYFLMTAVIGLIGYFIFIPRFSYWGAAGMTLFVEVLIVFLAYRLAKSKHQDLRLNFNVFNKSFLAGLLTLVAFWNFRDLNMFVLILAAGILYFVILYFTKAISKHELQKLFNK